MAERSPGRPPGYSIYSVAAPSNQLERLLWAEKPTRVGLAITPETLASSRQAIAAQRRKLFEEQGYNTGWMQVWPGLVFANPRNARPVMGPQDALKDATVETVAAFFRTYYAPDNAVLSIAGDFQTADVKKMAEQYFGGIASQPQPALPDLTEPPRPAESAAQPGPACRCPRPS